MKVYKDTPFEFGYLVWQVRPPRPSLTIVVKATYTIVPDGVCAIAEEQRPVAGDVHHDDDETQSVRVDSDMAVMKPRGECFLAGTCHPPGGKPATVSAVAFRVGAIEKQLAVIGDRHWARGLLAAGPS